MSHWTSVSYTKPCLCQEEVCGFTTEFNGVKLEVCRMAGDNKFACLMSNKPLHELAATTMEGARLEALAYVRQQLSEAYRLCKDMLYAELYSGRPVRRVIHGNELFSRFFAHKL